MLYGTTVSILYNIGFFDHQDNEYESREMEIGVAGLILT